MDVHKCPTCGSPVNIKADGEGTQHYELAPPTGYESPDRDQLAIDLLSNPDAMLWARTFMDIFGEKKNAIDLDLMLSWFANAITAGEMATASRTREKIDNALRHLYISSDAEAVDQTLAARIEDARNCLLE